MTEKQYLKIKEVEALIAKSKSLGKFNLSQLISKDNNLLDIGKMYPVQIFIGTEEDFNEINKYLIGKLKTSSKEEIEHIETLRSVIWHFRQLQEKQNAETVEMRNRSKFGMYKVPMPQITKNSKGELCDYESRTLLKEYFSSVEELIEDKETLRNIVEEHIDSLPVKQQFIIREILENKSQAEICKENNMNRKTVSGAYTRAVKNLWRLINSEQE